MRNMPAEVLCNAMKACRPRIRRVPTELRPQQTVLDHKKKDIPGNRYGDCDEGRAGFECQGKRQRSRAVTNRRKSFVTARKRNGGPGADTGIAARCVRLLLNRHGVPRGQEGHVVAEVLGLQYQQGRRKVAARSPWTLDQLRVIGARFGETLEQLLQPAFNEGWVKTSIVIGSWRAQGFALLGPLVEPPFQCALVAVGNAGQWVVVPAESINMQAHEVSRLSLCDPSSYLSPSAPAASPATP